MPTLPTNPHSIGDSGHVNDHNTIVTALSSTFYKQSGASSGESSSVKIDVRPWNMPWGIVAYKTEAGNLNYTSTETESAKTNSFTAVANRLYEVTYYEVSVHVAASQYAQLRLRLTNTSGTQLQIGYINNKAAVDYGQSFSLTWVGTLSAGSTVIISSIQSQTTTKTAYRGNDQPAVLIVKDIGPA